MTFQLYLIRHAIAEVRDKERWPEDSERPLSRAGVRHFKSVASGIARVIPPPQMVLSSPWLRCWQTAELLSGIGWQAPELLPSLIPGGDPRAILAALSDERSVAVVGHSPDLQRLASLLLAGDADLLSLEMKKGALLAIEVDRASGRGSLRWYVPPRLLRRLG